jgi:uncharacterized protein (DUF1800 family)
MSGNCDSMIERVAKAICGENQGDADAVIRSAIGDRVAWSDFIPEARAAIEAMREPLLAIIAEEEQSYLSPEYATGQPASSFSERFACRMVAKAIDRQLSPPNSP